MQLPPNGRPWSTSTWWACPTTAAQRYQRYGIPASAASSTSPHAGSTEQIEDKLSQSAFDALTRFSALANKSTGASHPYDRQRWFDFVIQAHLESSDLDSDFLERWLIESEDWPQDQASDLAIEYDRSRALLARFAETA
jgi:hypothetical protein